MDTSQMKKLTDLNRDQLFSLFDHSIRLSTFSTELQSTMATCLDRKMIEDAFGFYDLGIVSGVYEIFGGYTNQSFGVYTESNGRTYEFFVRKYKKGITERELELEHSLIDFSIANGLDHAAGLIRTNGGKTFVKLCEDCGGRQETRYFAVYDYLAGEDKYTWDEPYLSDEEYASSAEILATFHNAARDFDPKGRERVEPRILDLIATLAKTYRDYALCELKNKFMVAYLNGLPDILAELERIIIPEEAAGKMILNPIHADMHPGNMKYLNNRAVGLFDFDWAKIDLRLFDVCEGLVYFCSAWDDLPDGSTDGTLRLDKCRIFMDHYQTTLKGLGGLPPLNETEKDYFPLMMAAANMYVLNWDIATYFANPDGLNVYEYKTYLQHNIRLMKWIAAHQPELADFIRSY